MSSHIDASGAVVMVNVADKPLTTRTATAEGFIRVSPEVTAAIRANTLKKGDALATARVAGIMAVKNTSRAIPLCHDIPVSGCGVELSLEESRIRAVCRVVCHAKTGAEMEALSGVAAALLTIYDMAKSIDRGMEITGIRLLEKTGGASGSYSLPADGE